MYSILVFQRDSHVYILSVWYTTATTTISASTFFRSIVHASPLGLRALQYGIWNPGWSIIAGSNAVRCLWGILQAGVAYSAQAHRWNCELGGKNLLDTHGEGLLRGRASRTRGRFARGTTRLSSLRRDRAIGFIADLWRELDCVWNFQFKRNARLILTTSSALLRHFHLLIKFRWEIATILICKGGCT